MNPTARLFLLAGCVAIAAAASPLCARVAVEDLLGPYAQVSQQRVSDVRSPRPVAGEIEVVIEDVVLEGVPIDSRFDLADESAHDAP